MLPNPSPESSNTVAQSARPSRAGELAQNLTAREAVRSPGVRGASAAREISQQSPAASSTAGRAQLAAFDGHATISLPIGKRYRSIRWEGITYTEADFPKLAAAIWPIRLEIDGREIRPAKA